MEVGKKKNKKTKVILRDISAFVAPGRLVAVMGPTGRVSSLISYALRGQEPPDGGVRVCISSTCPGNSNNATRVTKRRIYVGMYASVCVHSRNSKSVFEIEILAAGCGKTSLINALAGRLPLGGTCTGEVLVNGKPRSKSFQNVTA